MKIADYRELKILDEVVYLEEPYTIVDFKRKEHLAQLKDMKKRTTKWVRCSEFEPKGSAAKPKKKQTKKINTNPIQCKAVNLHRAKMLTFRSIRGCAEHFGTSFYKIQKTIEQDLKINGYTIYLDKKEMEIQDYRKRLVECRTGLMDAMQKGDVHRVAHYQKETDWFEAKIKELEEDEAKLKKMENGDKNFGQMMGKVLSLVLNEADMAIYHLDIYFAALEAHGLVDKAKDWTNRKNQLRKALREFGEIPRLMMRGEMRNKNLEALCEMLSTIRDGYFTEKEQEQYDKYEELSGNY